MKNITALMVNACKVCLIMLYAVISIVGTLHTGLRIENHIV
jgi:hypothetical protein